VPDGATQRVRLARWPDVTVVVSELDFDRDGTPDHTEEVPGRPSTTPVGQGASADLSVAKEVSSPTAELGGSVTFTVTVSNAGPDTATEVKLFDALPGHAVVSDATTTHGSCATSPSGLQCDLLTLTPGEAAVVTYRATIRLPGALANGATVFGVEGDPDLTNNSAFAIVDVPVRVDVRPGRHANVVKVGSRELVPVAVLGQRGFSVRRIDASSLLFGPAGAPPAHDFCRHCDRDRCDDDDDHDRRHPGHVAHRGKRGKHHKDCGRLQDVNRDGRLDLVAYFRTDRTGIALGDTEACLRGTFHDGRSFGGCDAILTRRKGKHGHGGR
jgi:uncharacterized repeat protein (TIGR01451 family)